MLGPRSVQRTETIRALIVLAIISVTYLLIVNWGVVAALWREFVGAI